MSDADQPATTVPLSVLGTYTEPNRCWSNTPLRPVYEEGLLARSNRSPHSKNSYSYYSPHRVDRDKAAAWACGWSAGHCVTIVSRHFFARFDEISSSWVVGAPPHDLTGREYVDVW